MNKEFKEAVPLHPELHHRCIIAELLPGVPPIGRVQYLSMSADETGSWYECRDCGKTFKIEWPE
jgi:hypothetical protein